MLQKLYPHVHTKLDYCNALLSGSPKHLQKLQKVQNSAARLIYRSYKFNHVTPILNTLNWLPFEKRINFKLASFCFKSLNSSPPTYLSDLLRLYSPFRQLRSSADTRVFRIPSFRTKSGGQRSFSYQAPLTGNKLPASISHASSVSLLFNKQTNKNYPLSTCWVGGGGERERGSSETDQGLVIQVQA